MQGGRTESGLKPVCDLVLNNVALMPQIASCFKSRDVFIKFLEELLSGQAVGTEEYKQLARTLFIERSICGGAKTMETFKDFELL